MTDQWRPRILKIIRICTCMAICLTAATTHADPLKNPVRRTQLEDFDAMLKNQTSPCFVVAMAAWCAPCRKELPVINTLHEKYKDRGFTIIGLGLDLEGPQMLQPVVDKYKVRFPVYWVGEKAIITYKIHAIPVIWVVKDGKINERIAGVRTRAFLEKKIKALLRKDK